MTNLFLHAGAGEDAALLPQAGGDHLGHDGGVGCVFNLRGHTEHTDGESKTGSTITTTFRQTSFNFPRCLFIFVIDRKTNPPLMKFRQDVRFLLEVLRQRNEVQLDSGEK